MNDQTFGNLNSNLTSNLTNSLSSRPAEVITEPEEQRPTQMRVVLISISGETWSVWLPSSVEGRFRFQDEKGIEADLEEQLARRFGADPENQGQKLRLRHRTCLQNL